VANADVTADTGVVAGMCIVIADADADPMPMVAVMLLPLLLPMPSPATGLLADRLYKWPTGSSEFAGPE